jgi:putative endonuclease
VYILASRSRRLYVGVTSNLEKRLYQHRSKFVEGFSERYNINRLVYFEQFTDAINAITREKQVKGWIRQKKVALIEKTNPTWEDLSNDWVRIESNE